MISRKYTPQRGEVNGDFTKKAIKDTFIELLNERPLSQITVKDIVEKCGINRNSFIIIFTIFHLSLRKL